MIEQAKQRVANEKKKQNEKKRKAENHHKYIMGGIIVKYFPNCYSYDEDKLNRILSVVLQTRECQQGAGRKKSYPKEHDEEIIGLYRKGLSVRMTAKEMCCSPGHIQDVIKRQK